MSLNYLISFKMNIFRIFPKRYTYNLILSVHVIMYMPNFKFCTKRTNLTKSYLSFSGRHQV